MGTEENSIGEVFVSVGADLSQLHSDMAKAKTEAVAAAKAIGQAATENLRITREGKQVFGPKWDENLAKSRANRNFGKTISSDQAQVEQGIREQLLRSAKRLRGWKPSGDVSFDQMVGNDMRKGRGAPTPAELALYKQGEMERGRALEKQMAQEARAKAQEQKRLQKEAADAAKMAAREAKAEWTAAQKAAQKHAEELKARWEAFSKYVRGSTRLFGSSLGADLTGGISKAFTLLGGATKLFFAPLTLALGALKSLVPLLLAAVGAVGTFGVLSLRAAMQWQDLETRIGHMVGPQRLGALVKQANFIQSRTRYSSADALNALGLMKSSGIGGRAAAGGVANMAAITGGTMSSAAQQLLSGRSFALRRYGIEQSRDKGEMVVKFKLPSGQEVKLVGRSMTENTMNLLQAVNMKFAGAAVAGAKTLSGVLAQIRNLWGDAMRQFGNGLLPLFQRLGGVIVDKLNEFVASGKMEEWGKKTAAWLRNGVIKFAAAVEMLPFIFDEVHRVFKESPELLYNAITSAFTASIDFAADALYIAMKATLSFWKIVGQTIGVAFRIVFLDTLEKLNIPWLNVNVARAKNAMVGEGFNKVQKAFEGTADPLRDLTSADRWKEVQKQFPSLKGFSHEDFLSGKNPELRGVLSGIGGIDQIDGVMKSVSKATAEIKELSKEAFTAFLDKIKAAVKASGIDLTKIETEFLLKMFKWQGIIPPLEDGKKPDGKGGNETPTPAYTPVEVRSGSFAEWNKIAQDAAVKRKDSENLAAIADNTGVIADNIGNGGFLIA